jgi:hypothetical protein
MKNIVNSALIVILLVSCSPKTKSGINSGPNQDVSSEILDGFSANNIKSVHVVPVFAEQIGRESLAVPDSQATDDLITAIQVHTQLEVSGGIDRKFASNWNQLATGGEGEQISQLGTSKERLFKIAQTISKEEGGIPVLFCLLQKTAERSGSGVGSETAAQAKYRMWLYDGKLDKTVWSSAFRTKEEAVTENLFSLGSKFGSGFSSVRELVSAGFRGSAKNLDKLLRKKGSTN